MCDNEKGDTNKTLWDYFVKCDAENAKCLKCSAILKSTIKKRVSDTFKKQTLHRFKITIASINIEKGSL